MRITFIQPRLDLTGGARVVALYSQALMEMGHQVRVVAGRHQPERLRAKVKKWLRGEYRSARTIESQPHHRGAGVDVRVLETFRPIVDDDVPDGDVVIATWWETAEWVNRLAATKGAKVYFIQHHETFEYMPVDRVRATYRLPLHKIVIAGWLKDLMASEYGDHTVDLVPNSVDRSQFFAPPRDKQAKPTVGFLYSTAPFKGVDITLRAIQLLRQRMPDLRVISFGSQQPSRELPLPAGTEFHCSPPQDGIKLLYSQCDAWVTASRSEGFNLPALEAMACRTPIVATRAGWPAEAVVTGKNGVLVDVDDVAAVAGGAEWILSRSAQEWRALSDAAYATSQVGSWEESAAAFEAALQHACRRAARGEIAGGRVASPSGQATRPNGSSHSNGDSPVRSS
jgi:glycosyltransferase involved in cell wall biosynthesis